MKDCALVLEIVVLILVPPQVLCLNTETCVLAETEASNSRAWVAVTRLMMMYKSAESCCV